MFSINTAPEKFEKATITVHFGFSLRLRKTRTGKLHVCHTVMAFNSKSSVLKMFSVNAKERKAGVFKFLWFEKRF